MCSVSPDVRGTTKREHVPVEIDPKRVGQFDDDLARYTTAKGVSLQNNLVPNQFRHLSERGVAVPGYHPNSTAPPRDALEVVSEKMLEEISKGTHSFKDTPRFKTFRGSYWLYAYYALLDSGRIPAPDPAVVRALQGKAIRSQSGVVVNTITLSPYPYGRDRGDGSSLNSFSCKFDCSFCPNQPGVPRSYLAEEPAVMRGIAFKYNPVAQTFNRLSTLFYMGHQIDKVEVKFIGGTWNSFSLLYRKWVVWQTYHAHNIFYDPPSQDQDQLTSEFDPDQFTGERLDGLIREAQEINSRSRCRVIGLTVETRPDCLDREELVWLRRFGCTRLEMGLQHTDDDVLRYNRRGHLLSHSMRAIKLAKDHGFKIVIHLMPQLPGSNPERDREMITRVITDPDLQADEWKLYNTEVTPYTQIYQWYLDGSYRPYSDQELKEVYLSTLPRVPEYIRIDRLKRDIPATYTVAGVRDGGFRNRVFEELNGSCIEMRNREIKDGTVTSWRLEELEYRSSRATDIFLTVKNQDDRLCGFCRLRLPDPGERLLLPELEQLRLSGGVALIRELHVYGNMTPVSSSASNSQHRGFGQSLVRRAEQIARNRGYRQMAIIAGIGTRPYYRDKLGYRLAETYMTKQLTGPKVWPYLVPVALLAVGFFFALGRQTKLKIFRRLK
jgi:ELP3 family radical SAM enzyme/protein acetyltransferase